MSASSVPFASTVGSVESLSMQAGSNAHSVKEHQDMVLILDIKSTGVDVADDIIAIGFCAMTYDRKIIKKYRFGLKLRTDAARSNVIVRSVEATWLQYRLFQSGLEDAVE